MFIPYGDDLNKNTLPAASIFLVAINCMIYAYTTRLWFDSVPQLARCESKQSYVETYHRTPYGRFIDEWSASPRNLKQGNPVGLLTHMFIHADIYHLLGNMMILWVFVGTLEIALGSARLVCLYFFWGLVAALAQLFMTWNKDHALIGASGAISGVIGGYLLVFGALTKIRGVLYFPLLVLWTGKIGTKVQVPSGAFVVFWTLTQFAGFADAQKYGDSDNVGWYAHFGGFIAGLATMVFFKAEITGRMILDRSGAIVLQNEEEAERAAMRAEEARAIAEAANAPKPPPSECPHCGVAMSEKDKIHDLLFRCPNASCKKLIYHQ